MLNSNQQKFCELYALESNGTASYKKAYADKPNTKTESASQSASRLLERKEIKDEIERLREPARQAAILSLIRKREVLCEIVEDREENTGDRLRAIGLDAKLAGELPAPKAPASLDPLMAGIAEALKAVKEVTHGR